MSDLAKLYNAAVKKVGKSKADDTVATFFEEFNGDIAEIPGNKHDMIETALERQVGAAPVRAKPKSMADLDTRAIWERFNAHSRKRSGP